MKRKAILLAYSLLWFCGSPLLAQDTESVSSASEVAPATVQAATPKRVILDDVDNAAQRLVGGVSQTIENAKDLLVDVAGGEESTLGVLVDSVSSLTTGNFWGRPFWLYLLSFFIVLVALFSRYRIVHALAQFLKRAARATRTTLDEELIDAFLPCIRLAVALIGIYVGFQVLFAGELLPDPPETVLDRFRHFFKTLMYLLLLGNVAWALLRTVDVLIIWASKWARKADRRLDETFLPIGQRTAKVFIVVVVVLQGLDYLQFDTVVNSLLAAAGVGGLAVGLAAQDTIKNFFGSVVLLLDRPFSVGDWIVAGDTEGIVETVGLRSTKIRTFEKTLITVPNSSIVDRDIDNMARRPVRRIMMTVGVTYKTKPDEMEEVLRRIRELLKNDPGVWQGFMIVRFTDFGASSLDIFLYYFSNSIIWDEYLEVRERINLGVMRILEELGLEIAFPTRSIYIEKDESSQGLPGTRDRISTRNSGDEPRA